MFSLNYIGVVLNTFETFTLFIFCVHVSFLVMIQHPRQKDHQLIIRHLIIYMIRPIIDRHFVISAYNGRGFYVSSLPISFLPISLLAQLDLCNNSTMILTNKTNQNWNMCIWLEAMWRGFDFHISSNQWTTNYGLKEEFA